MGYKSFTRIDDVLLILEQQGKTVLRVLDEANRAYEALIEAQNGASSNAWGRVLFDLGDTENVTLTVVASDKTIEGLPGHSVFNGFVPGRTVDITNFTNAGNNVTALQVSSVINPDKLYLANWASPVDETDADARVRENPTTAEFAVVTDIISARTALNELSLARTQDVTSSDRASDLEAFIL